MPFDMRPMFRRLVRNPDEIPKVLADMQARFEKQMVDQKKK